VAYDAFDRSDWWDPGEFLYGMRELLNPVRIPYITRHFHQHGVRSVLDVGCGGGFITHSLSAAGFQATGVDYSSLALMAAVAQDHTVRGGQYSVADAHRLPFADGKFDGVVLSEVLEHVEDPASVLEEAARVLAPGGVMVVTGPNRTRLSRITLIGLAQEWPTRVLPRGLHSHAAFVPTGQLNDWWDWLGMAPIDITGLGVRFRRIPSALTALVKLRWGRISYGEAGRIIELVESRSPAIAYLASARKGS